MRRTMGRFLASFILMVASGAALILIIPSALGTDPAIAAWVPITLGALFAASAFVAFQVRPAAGRRPR
ncbi:hypothetical protein QFZ62_001697 [Clavibacter sp. B3I6]|jgi:hypothetical protein|uniref:hypothetical protein n=1 Tax=Clavibacter sp. B3I6 TaxID=3042268 RepID=UPI002785B7DC|nr:hypothetical protein [Clavibacter sp. B3I6]MDQ0744389.1 hypothetical protein [Clavibacter sp. B3I6]